MKRSMNPFFHKYFVLLWAVVLPVQGWTQAGCTIEFACNYDPLATENDGSCEFLSCLVFGCTDLGACNFNGDADYDDGTCVYASFPFDCEGNCVNDDDGDGVCDEFEVFGCMDEMACNFISGATNEAGSCYYDCSGCTIEGACNYDPAALVDDGTCDFESCLSLGCTDNEACNFDASAVINDGSCTFPSNGECDCLGNVPDALGECGGNCPLDADGDGVCDVIFGCTNLDAPNFDPDATFDDGSCQIPGCTVQGACNFNMEANFDDGSCDFLSCLVIGCTDVNGCNYDSEAQLQGTCEYPEAGYTCNGDCVTDSDGDGVCDPFEVSGCTDETAFNFDPNATEENGSCIEVVEGCLEIAACNYDAQANVNDDSCDFDSCVGCLLELACNYNPIATQSAPCEWPEVGYDCQGNCTLDLNENGICDPEETQGCMYPTAINFMLEASFDDGSCVFEGCTSSVSDTYSPNANELSQGACTALPIRADFNLDGLVQLLDFTEFLVSLGQSYPGWTLTWLNDACQYEDVELPNFVEGCTYANAWNYDPQATADLNTCLFLGCTDSLGLNYDPLANADDGSCYYTPCPDLDRDQSIDIQDLLDFFQLWGMAY